MLDIKLIRENPALVKANLKKRNDLERPKMLDELIDTDKKWRAVLQEVEEQKAKRNVITEQIAQMKKSKPKDAEKKIKEIKELPEKIKELDGKAELLKQHVNMLLMRLPNLLHESVPVGKDETENKEIRKWGKPPKFDFQPKNHLELALNLDLIDEERGAKASGRGFFYLKKELVILDHSLLRYAIDFMLKRSYTLIEPPFMIRRESFEGTTDLENLKQQIYKIDGEDLFLIGTAEHALASMLMNETLSAETLPLKFIGVSPCFRKEVGTHGKYTKGLFRMHHFNKVEQFIFCKPEDSWKLFDELQKNSEDILQSLGLHHRVITLCSGDTGTVAAKTNDNEVWMADGKFREVGSNSNCTDYQARRLNIKYREKTGAAPAGFVHTINNTALATSRVMLAILEQFQQRDGSILIPKLLQQYCGFDKIKAKKQE